MDRATVYAGQIPREVDILNTGRFGMIGIGMLAAATLGTGIAVAGFAMRPTAPASLIATISAGQIYQVANIDATAWSSLPADTRSIVKQGMLLDDLPLTFAPPTTPGYSQSFLVQAQYQDGDTDQRVLPYYNAANPSQGFSGPGGSGSAQNTNRRGVAAIQIKAGIASAAGTQQAPSPDAGWAPLFIVTLSAGQTTISAGNIVQHPSAPFVPATLMQVPGAVQSGKWQYAVASGVNALQASLSPAPDALVNGLSVRIACPSANTAAVSLALNGFNPGFIVRKDGTPLRSGDIAAGDVISLIYKDGVFRFASSARSEFATSLPQASLWHCGVAAGAPGALTVDNLVPPIPAYTSDQTPCLIVVPFAPSAAATINIMGLGAIPIRRADDTPIQNGDVIAGDMLGTIRNGAFRLVSLGRAEVQRITLNPILWVRTDGNDANDGSANDPAHAFATLAGALNRGTSQFNFASSALTVRLGVPGTYTSPQYLPTGTGQIAIIGDANNMGAYVISGAGSPGQGSLQTAGNLSLTGLTIQNTGATSHTFVGTVGASVLCTNVAFVSTQTTTGNHVYGVGGSITLASGCSIQGSAGAALWGETGGQVNVNTNTQLNILGNPRFSTATAVATNQGRIGILPGSNISGSATGTRYIANNFSIIATNGAGPNAFPGDAAGSINNAIYS